MATLKKTLDIFVDRPEKYLFCRKELLSKLLQGNPRAIDFPFGEAIYAHVLNHQLCSVERAYVQGDALLIKHFAVSISEDFDDMTSVDLRRKGIGRSMMRGLARVMGPTCSIRFIDFDLGSVNGKGGAEAYARFTDGLGALPYGDLRRLPIATLLA